MRMPFSLHYGNVNELVFLTCTVLTIRDKIEIFNTIFIIGITVEINSGKKILMVLKLPKVIIFFVQYSENKN